MSVNVILSGHGMNSEPYLANLAATEEGIAYIYNAKRDLDEAEGEFYLTSELMDQPLDMTSLDENGELSDFITALRVWDRVAKENVAKKIDFQSLGNFPKGSINQILAYSEVDEEGNPTGFKAMAALGGVNANLLHNWYFANPVNQRGQTEYTEAGYTIDRWKKTTSDGAVTMTAGGITATNEAGAGTLYLSQYLRGFDLRNFDCVFSVLTENGLFLTKQVEATGSQDETPFGYLRIGWSESANCSFVQIQITQGNTANILAAKLELGEGQTLAHQDADGNWVLNEIPDYAEELAKCQRYQVIMSGLARYRTILVQANSLDFYIPTPVTMRAVPAFSVPTARITSFTSSASFTDATWSVLNINPAGVYIRATKSGHGFTDARADLEGGAIFDANL